jgi:hypothetical protein
MTNRLLAWLKVTASETAIRSVVEVGLLLGAVAIAELLIFWRSGGGPARARSRSCLAPRMT